VASLALLTLASTVPVPISAVNVRPAGPPPALLRTQELLAALKETKVPDPRGIEQLDERSQELSRRPTDEQYSHSALEAADALQNQTTVAVAALAAALEAAANALRAAETAADLSGPAGQLAAALAGLRDGTLPVNQELLDRLPATSGALKSLTADQKAQLSRQLGAAAKGLKGVVGAMGAGAQVAVANDDGVVGTGSGSADEAPLMLAAQASDAGAGTTQALSEGELKRLGLGDKLGLTTGAHQVDPAQATAAGAAGAVAAPGQGGEAVWVNRLTPAERAALKKFFK
jgi:hypothetical protein